MAGTETDAEQPNEDGPAETPENVAREATIEDALPLHRIALLGIFGKEGDWGALIRKPEGTVLKVALGDRTPVGEVVGIDETQVVLQSMGSTIRLRMPPPARDDGGPE